MNAATAILEADWLGGAAEQLRRMRAAIRMPSGLLIHEDRGAGGGALARYAAQLALCSGAVPPCGQCRDCQLFEAGTHPDFISVTPLEESKLIRVEQIRQLAEQLSLSSHGGGATVVLLAPADTLNANAANALLKTLEEPRAGVTLLLLTALPSRLPATILSRCQRLRARAPDRRAAIAWLEAHRGSGPWAAVLDLIGNAPFEAVGFDPAETARLKLETERALTEVQAGRAEIASIAERWAKADSFELRLACIETWLTARIDASVGSRRDLAEMRSGAHLPESSSDMNMVVWLRLLDAAYELRRLRLTSINRSLALEQLLWQLQRVARAAA